MMKKYKRISIFVFLIIIIAAAVFFVFGNRKPNITEEDIKVIIKEEYGFDVEILDSYETHEPVSNDIIFPEKDKIPEIKYIARTAKVRTIGKDIFEFKIEVKKVKGKPLRIVRSDFNEEKQKHLN